MGHSVLATECRKDIALNTHYRKVSPLSCALSEISTKVSDLLLYPTPL